ncbi:hypothetical protein [Demequina zhanjiangensis]|uniref:Uncharacterized protein n=1 Tax=Demequina zhanjiangensis TaxID=3051659 RepID=A0ABT8G4P1_9MICO|nr:hypothetical protein [Demequina sp. SYSU T00b26]MDN4474105.1 hypothetical protein [Demequina sp. SYSU T00b26]
MFSDKRRVSLAATAVLAASTLAGCAVPGQGDPGVAAEGAGVTVTLEEVQSYSEGLLDIGILDNADWALTLALFHDAAIDEAADLGMAWSDDEIAADIEAWAEVIGYPDADTSPEAIEVTHTAKAIGFLATSEEGSAFLSDMANELEADSVSSPRFGDFTAAAFFDSLSQAASSASDNVGTIGETVYVVFVAITGYADAASAPDWFGSPEPVAPGGTDATPEPSTDATE